MELSKGVKLQRGFTVIDVIFFISIFAIASMAFYRTISDGVLVSLDAKYRLGALALANEKIEIIRNLQYNSIGTTEGIPVGIILEDENVTASGKLYHVKTFIQYIDDEFDDKYPTDAVPNDFKSVKITVSWGSATGATKEVSLVSRFVPAGLEVESGDGVLSVNIIDGSGTGVSQAHIHLVNNDVSPNVNVSSNTNNDGNIIFPGAKQSIQKYRLTVSKDGYETVTTLDPAGVSYNYTDINASVMAGLLNTKSVVINRLANLSIVSRDYTGTELPGVDFHLKGGRILGTDNAVIPAVLVYILDTDETTDSDGEKLISNHSPGQFFMSEIESPIGYTLIGVSPVEAFDGTSSTYTTSVLPGNSAELLIKYAKNSDNALLVKVKTKTEGTPVNGAQVKLSNADGYSVTVTTSFDGVAFFPTDNVPLVAGDYSLEITADGFDDYTDDVTVDALITQESELIVE
ncbi:carboxypeptidase regulatory-like domain-containing protein [Patescibacteria group bacterium]|nr:MAG: carboxypeptidase regulatory-like domain-containing protein [Patescibacteria group bacterium]